MHYLLSCPATARLRPVPAAATRLTRGDMLRRCETKAALIVHHTPTQALLEVLRVAPLPALAYHRTKRGTCLTTEGGISHPPHSPPVRSRAT